MSETSLKARGESSPNMDETEIAHLAGVIDAIGTVSVHISKNENYVTGYQMQAIIRVIRPMDDSDPILGKIMEYADERGVRYSISEKSHGKDRENKSYEWVCKVPSSIPRFLEPMLPYLVTEFQSALIMLNEIIPRIEDEQHHTKEGFYELMEYADMIRKSKRGPNKTYDQEFFAEEWSLPE